MIGDGLVQFFFVLIQLYDARPNKLMFFLMSVAVKVYLSSEQQVCTLDHSNNAVERFVPCTISVSL